MRIRKHRAHFHHLFDEIPSVMPKRVPARQRFLVMRGRCDLAWEELDALLYGNPLWHRVVLDAAKLGVSQAQLEAARVCYDARKDDWVVGWVTDAIESGGLDERDEGLARELRAAARWRSCGDADELVELVEVGTLYDPDTMVWYAEYLHHAGRKREAFDLLKDLVDDGDGQGSMVLGNLLRDDGRVDEAISVFERGYHDGGDAHVAMNLGLVLVSLDQAQARRWIKRAADGGDRLAVRWLRSDSRERRRLRAEGAQGGHVSVAPVR